jgi:hypothetical protein
MKIRPFIVAVAACVTGSAMAAEAQTSQLPFLIKSRATESFTGELTLPDATVTPTRGAKTLSVGDASKIMNVPSTEISNVIRQLRDATCDAVGDGQVRAWLQGSASAKIFGIGGSADSGLEVTIRCSSRAPSSATTKLQMK